MQTVMFYLNLLKRLSIAFSGNKRRLRRLTGRRGACLSSLILLFVVIILFTCYCSPRFPYQLAAAVSNEEMAGVWKFDEERCRFYEEEKLTLISKDDYERFELILNLDGSFQMHNLPSRFVRRVSDARNIEYPVSFDGSEEDYCKWVASDRPCDEYATIEGQWEIVKPGNYFALELAAPGYGFDHLLLTTNGLFWQFGGDMDSLYGIAFKKTDGNYSPRGYDLEDRPRLW